jgi:hypothetical protein
LANLRTIAFVLLCAAISPGARRPNLALYDPLGIQSEIHGLLVFMCFERLSL